MGVLEGTDAVWDLLGSSKRSSASQLGSPAWRWSREKSMLVLPPDQPSATLEGVFHFGEDRKSWRWKVLLEDSPVNPIVPVRAPCGSGSFGLCWGGNGRGRESQGCQATLPVYWEDKSHNNGKKGSFPRLLFVSLFLRGSAHSDPRCSSREHRDLFMLQRTKRFILGDENWDFWICWDRGLAETGTPGFGEEKGLWEKPIPYLRTHPTHVPLAFGKHLCVCSFPVSKEEFCRPCSERGLRLVLGFAWIEAAPSAPGD